MIEPYSINRIPSYHPEVSRLTEDPIESLGSEATSSTSEDISSAPSSSRSSPEAISDILPEEIVSSSSTSPDPSLTPVTAPNTPLHRQLAAIVQRAITRNNRSQQILNEKANFKKNYDSFVNQIGKDSVGPPPPSYYREGMRLLGDKILSPVKKNEPNVSKVDLMINPHAYFSKSDLKTLRALQSFLLNKITTGPRNGPLHENDWWALEHLPCITPDETGRNSLIETAAAFKDVLTKDLPLHLLRLELKAADQNLAETSAEQFYSMQRDYNDPYYKSRWETAFDLEMFGLFNDTIEIIKNNQADIASIIRKWGVAYIQKQGAFSTDKHDTTSQIRNDARATNKIAVPKKSVQTKYQEEYRDLSSLRQKLEKIHDNLFVVASNVFGGLTQKNTSPYARDEFTAGVSVPKADPTAR